MNFSLNCLISYEFLPGKGDDCSKLVKKSILPLLDSETMTHTDRARLMLRNERQRDRQTDRGIWFCCHRSFGIFLNLLTQNPTASTNTKYTTITVMSPQWFKPGVSEPVLILVSLERLLKNTNPVVVFSGGAIFHFVMICSFVICSFVMICNLWVRSCPFCCIFSLNSHVFIVKPAIAQFVLQSYRWMDVLQFNVLFNSI